MSDSIETLQQSVQKLELAKRKQDISIFQQIIEPLAEAIEELTEQLSKKAPEKNEPDYFDKELNKNLVASIDKVFKLLQGFKQQLNISIDVTPIAAEIKAQNAAILGVLNKLNTGQSDEICRMVQALIGKQNVFLEKSQIQADYAPQLQKISEEISKKDNRVEKLTVVYNVSGDRIKEVIPIYKSK